MNLNKPPIECKCQKTNTDYILIMKELRDFSAKEGLSIEQSIKLSNLLTKLDSIIKEN